MKNLVSSFAAQQVIDLALNLLALVALHPLFPVILCLPCADHQEFIRLFEISHRFTGNVPGLIVCKRSHFPKQRDHFPCLVFRHVSPDQYFNCH